MKFIKKVAALCFCAALALSVMAVSASATAPVFTVELVQDSVDTRTDLNHDTNAYVEYDNGDTLTYKIVLKSDSAGGVSVNGLDFKLDATNTGKNGSLTSPVVTFTDASDATAPTTGGVYIISYDDGTDADDYISVDSSTGVVIGTVAYTVNAPAASKTDQETLTFGMTDIHVHHSGTFEAISPSQNPSVTFEVDPEYTITLKKPGTESSGVTDNSWVDADTTYEYKYTLLNGTTSAVPAPTITAYTFNYFAPSVNSTSAAVGNWATTDRLAGGTSDTDAGAANFTLPAYNASTNADPKYGDVTLYAYFTATPFAISYDTEIAHATLDNPSGAWNAKTKTYTIEDTATDSAYDIFGEPECDGYDFDGWAVTVATSGEGVEQDWTASDSTLYTASSNIVGKYGAITVKANFTIHGEFMAVNYKYAKHGEYLMLFAVEDAAKKDGTYYFGGSADANKMFVVDMKYAPLFGKVSEDEGAADKVASTGWTIYGYLSSSNNKENVSFTNSGSNASVDYTDADITGNTAVNSGDYGVAGAMITRGNDSTLYDDEANFTMARRLQANMGALASGSTWCGTINDINEIMAKIA